MPAGCLSPALVALLACAVLTDISAQTDSVLQRPVNSAGQRRLLFIVCLKQCCMTDILRGLWRTCDVATWLIQALDVLAAMALLTCCGVLRCACG